MKYTQSPIIIALSIILAACGSVQSDPTDKNVSLKLTTEIHDQIQPEVQLPGIERSLIIDSTSDLSAQTIPIECKYEPSGPYYREQSKDLDVAAYNLIQYDLFIGVAKNKDPFYPYAYTGGDTQANGGALDAGIYADKAILYNNNPIWNTFINYAGDQGSTQIDNGLPGYTYRLTNNQKISMKMWIVPNTGFVKMSVSGMYLELNKITGTLNPTNNKPFQATKIFTYPKASAWGNSNAIAAFKVMTSIAINKGSGINSYKYSIDNQSDGIASEGFKYTNIKVGKGDANGVVSNLTDWNSLLASPTKATPNPCKPPDDMTVVDVPNHSAKISLRVKSKFEFSFVNPVSPIGKNSETLTNNFIIKNAGPAGSTLYYDFTSVNQKRQRGELLTGKSITGIAKYTCTAKSETFNQPVNV